MKNIIRWSAIAVSMLWLGSYGDCAASGRYLDDDLPGKHRFGFMGALTSGDVWMLEAEYHFMVCPYVGLGGSLGTWKQYMSEGYPSGSGWMVEDDDLRMSNVYLRPSLLLVSPSLFKIGDVGVGVMAEPGVMMNIPYKCVSIDLHEHGITTDYTTRSSSKGQWCAVDCRAGVNITVGPVNITAGYLISNFDIYGIARNIEYQGVKFDQFYPRKRSMQGAFLSLTCKM